jgi:hypothetical protein
MRRERQGYGHSGAESVTDSGEMSESESGVLQVARRRSGMDVGGAEKNSAGTDSDVPLLLTSDNENFRRIKKP